MRNQFFSQYSLEHAISKHLEFGVEVHLAERLGVSPGLISQYFNPHDTRESPIYKAAAMFSEWIDLDPDNGRAALELFCLYVRKALPPSSDLSSADTRPKVYKENAEYQLAEAEQKPRGEVMRELRESIAAKREHLAALEAEEKREKRAQIFETVSANGRAR